MSLAIESGEILCNSSATPNFDFAIPFRRGRVKKQREEKKRKKIHSITRLIYTPLVSYNINRYVEYETKKRKEREKVRNRRNEK